MQQSLKHLEGVKNVDVDLDIGKIEITPKKEAAVDPALLGKTVKDSGITLDAIEVVATGRLIRTKEGKSAFSVSETEQIFLLEDNEQAKKLTAVEDNWTKLLTVTGSFPLPETKEKAKKKQAQKEKSPWTLSIQSYEIEKGN